MEGEPTSRRALLRSAFTRAGRAANTRLAGTAQLEDTLAAVRGDDLGPRTAAPVVRAPCSAATATLNDLLGAAEEVGLAARRAELVAAARWSVQLAPKAAPGAPAKFGGSARLPEGAGWPSVDGRALTLLAAVDLDRLAPASLPFEGQGTLLFFFDTAAMPSGLDPARVGGRVLHVSREQPSAAASGPALPRSARSAAATVELVIPRVWSVRVDALGLTDDERDAWELVRQRLADAQGTELTEQVVSASHVSHRVLGYAEETSGEMPLICELCDRGYRIDGHPLTHPHAGQAEPESDRWELLAQFSRDTDLNWRWREGIGRIYFWIDRTRLAVGDLSKVRAIAR